MVTWVLLKTLVVILSILAIASHMALNILHEDSTKIIEKYFGNTTIVVIAHPDDESMFFGPTIMKIVQGGKFVLCLCLTNGNADHLAHLREGELISAVRAFGPKASLNLIRDPELPDSMTASWEVSKVSNHIEHVINNHDSPIDTLVTFDAGGISGHINHRSIYWASKYLKNKSKGLKLDIMHLETVSILRKYTSYLDSMTSVIFRMQNKSEKTLTIALDLANYSTLKAILELHKSQMVWFRKLYMIFSRYMFINDLVMA